MKIVDDGDGKKKAEVNRWFLKNRKVFKPTNTCDLFSQFEGGREPREVETKLVKKVSLAKTFDNRNKWRPVTRGSDVFTATKSSSFSRSEVYPASIA